MFNSSVEQGAMDSVNRFIVDLALQWSASHNILHHRHLSSAYVTGGVTTADQWNSRPFSAAGPVHYSWTKKFWKLDACVEVFPRLKFTDLLRTEAFSGLPLVDLGFSIWVKGNRTDPNLDNETSGIQLTLSRFPLRTDYQMISKNQSSSSQDRIIKWSEEQIHIIMTTPRRSYMWNN